MGLKFKDKVSAGIPQPGDIAERELHLDLKNKHIYSSTNGLDILRINENSVDGMVLRVAKMADLSTVDPTKYPSVVVEEENISGLFIYDATQATTNDHGTIFFGWVRQYEGAADARWFGANTTRTDNQIPINLALAACNSVYIPAGTYETSEAVIMHEAAILSGELDQRYQQGGTLIKNTGTGNCLTFSYSKELYDAGVENIKLQSANGHALQIKEGAVRCFFKSVSTYTLSITHSCIYMKFTATQAGVYNTVFQGGDHVVDNNVARTAPIFRIQSAINSINSNVFKDMWLNQSAKRQAISLGCTAPGTYLYNNVFENIVFEICAGGAYSLNAVYGTRIINNVMWDTPSYNNHIIDMGTDTAVMPCSGTVIDGYTRAGNVIAASVNDIRIAHSDRTTISNFQVTNGTDRNINFGDTEVVFIGEFDYGKWLLSNNTTFIGGKQIRTKRLQVGDGFLETAGLNTKLSSGASVVFEANDTNLTQVLNFSSNAYYGGYGALFPSSKDIIDLGGASNKFKNLYMSGVVKIHGSTGFTGTVASPTSITVVGGIVTAVS